MPFPLLPALALGATLWTSHKARKAQKEQNQKDRTFQSNMYNRNVLNNRQDFATANAYNDPAQQMNRLRQAGLSPHLVYGKGADNTAAMVKHSSGSAPNQTAPQPVDIPGALGQFQQLQQIQAQTDNVNANTEVQRQESILKRIQGIKTMHEAGHSKFDLKLKKDMEQQLKDAIILENQLKSAKQDNLDANTQLTSKEIDAYQNIVTKHKNDIRLQQLEIELRKLGFSERDPAWQKAIIRAFMQPEQIKKLQSNFNK